MTNLTPETPSTQEGRPEHFTLLQAFACAFAGVKVAAKGRNFRIQLGFAVLAIALGFAFRISQGEWLAVAICIGMVLAFETANTAFEAVVDLVSPDYHPLAKTAKDAAAGAPLIASVASFIVGVILFLPRILQLMG